MKTKIKTVVLTILCYPIISQAQVSPNVIKRFPAHIVYSIDDVNTKAKLSEDQQIKIGKKLFIADSLANISLTKGEPIAKLKSYYTIDSNFLKPILSTQELEHYEYIQNKDNRLLVALEFAKDLKLEQKQISEIRKQNNSLSTVPVISIKETIQNYNTILNTILNKEQYVSLLKIIHKDQSIDDAKKDWERIKKLKLVNDEKKLNEYQKIENYHSLKNSLLDLNAEKYDKKKLEKLIAKITLQEPPILIRANILSAGEFKNNTFSSIIKYEKETNLSEAQIDTILAKYKQLEQIRFENEEIDLTNILPIKEPSEYENIIKILSPEQINVWLANKNKNQAMKVALKNWKKLEMEGLIKDLNKEATILDFSNYQLKYFIADEKTRMYNTPEYAFYKRDIEQKKLELLKQLDVIARNKSKGITTKNGLAW